MIHFPAQRRGPLSALSLRLLAALGLVFATVFVVWLDRDGYRDVDESGLTLLDCFYYVVVSLSTTGYGDITPVSPSARLANVLFITPARVLFLIILVGTTLEVLTEQYRTGRRLSRWRRTVKDHVIICGYGTKGRTAAAAMVGDEIAPGDIVVVDEDTSALDRAKSAGLVTVRGTATDSEVLRLAGAQHAKTIIVAANRDDTAVLVTLTARELAPRAQIIAAVRETDNEHLLKQSGADSTVVTSETAGRLLGIAVQTPSVVEMMEDLLTPDRGFAIAEREVSPKEAGGSPRHQTDIVLGVERNKKLIRVDDPEVDALELGDRLLYIRSADEDR